MNINKALILLCAFVSYINILSIPGMVCRPFMDQHPDKVKIFEIDSTAFILDVDTEEDIQKLGITR